MEQKFSTVKLNAILTNTKPFYNVQLKKTEYYFKQIV